MSTYSTQYMQLLKEAYEDDGLTAEQDAAVSMLQKNGFMITRTGRAEYGPGGKIVYMTRRKGGSMAVAEVDSDGMVNDQTPANYLADILDEGTMCEHHDEEKFPQDLLEVSIVKVLDLMEEQAEGDEETKDLYEKIEQWLIDNEKELIPDAEEEDEEDEDKEESEDGEQEDKNETEENSEDEEVEESYTLTEAKKWIPSTMRKGALHKKLGIPEDKEIPMSRINSEITRLSKESEGEKKLSAADLRYMKMLVMAKNLKKISKK